MEDEFKYHLHKLVFFSYRRVPKDYVYMMFCSLWSLYELFQVNKKKAPGDGTSQNKTAQFASIMMTKDRPSCLSRERYGPASSMHLHLARLPSVISAGHSLKSTCISRTKSPLHLFVSWVTGKVQKRRPLLGMNQLYSCRNGLKHSL